MKIKLIRAVLIIVGTYYLGMFVLPVFGIIFNIGSILGAIMSLCAILVGVFFNRIIDFCKVQYKTKKGKRMLNTFFTAFGVGVLCFCITLGSIVLSNGTNATDQSTVIVLGCSVVGDVPSIMLNNRVKKACEYLEQNPDSVAILSGGQGADESISEAECMYRLLTERGIATDRLYLEDKSINTRTNIENSAKIINDNGLSKDIVVVSSDYHLKRATMVCRKCGFSNVHRISAQSTYFDKPTFYLREVLAVAKEFITK